MQWGTKDNHYPIQSGYFQKNNLEMSSRKTAGRRGTTKKRAQRATSNVFAMFNQDQIQEFKEAFGIIDNDKDGIITAPDLKKAFEVSSSKFHK